MAAIARSSSLNSLLSIWNLDCNDLQDVHIRGLVQKCLDPQACDRVSLPIICAQCTATNSASNNWCIECGKCISSHSSGANRINQSTEMNGHKDVETSTATMKCEKTFERASYDGGSFTSKSQRGTDTNFVHNSSVIAQLKQPSERNYCEKDHSSSYYHFPPHSVHCHQQPHWLQDPKHSVSTYKRKWPTSSFYIWRNKKSVMLQPNELTSAKAHDHASEMCMDSNKPSSEMNSPPGKEPNQLPPYQQSSSLLLLPNELILMILSNLSSQDLVASKRVCKHLHHLILHFILGIEAVLTGVIYCDTLRSCCETCPSSLTLRKCQFHSKLSATDIEMSIFEVNYHLKRLTLDTCNMGVTGCDTLLRSVAANCPNVMYIKLEWICVTGSVFLNMMKKLRKIEELHLINVSGISSKDWTNVLISLSQGTPDCRLHTLQLKLRPELPASNILGRGNHILSLKSISFRQNMSKLSEIGMKSLLAGGPNIKNMEIECFEVSRKAVEELSKRAIKYNLINNSKFAS